MLSQMQHLDVQLADAEIRNYLCGANLNQLELQIKEFLNW
jgi:hypothetical protein